MPNIPLFDKKIKQIIKYFEYDMYLIHPDEKINCSCLDYTTHQGDPKCSNCLGTGKKIYISIVKAARQPYVLTDLRSSKKNADSGAIYYSRDIYPVNHNDIFVTGKYIDVVQYTERYQSDHYGPVYYASHTALKQMDAEIFFKNFREIVGEYL